MNIYANEYFTLSAVENRVYISVCEPDYPFTEFEQVLQAVPRVQITQFGSLRKVIQQNLPDRTEVGRLKPEYELVISPDYMKATIRYYLSEDEYESKQQELAGAILGELKQKGITEGILYDALNGPFTRQEMLIAQGIQPVEGVDAVIRYFELSERKPTIHQDGTVDYYELNFIDEVEEGDWLGEKILATTGMPGRNLKGGILPARKGRDKPLYYDKETIEENQEDGKIVLRAKINGAVAKAGRSIEVQRVLTIHGDVGPKTGNIDYDGSVQITGTIMDGYSVTATQDISILSQMGIGAAESITSESGDIFIKGGIFGKDRTVISAARDVFVKLANDCTIRAGEKIHIGLYSMGSKLYAKYVYLDKSRGKIIGGLVQAQVQVISAFIGNEMERPTVVQIEGFNRAQVKQELEALLKEYQTLLTEIENVRKEVDLFGDRGDNGDSLTGTQKKDFIYYWSKQESSVDKIHQLEEARKKLMAYLSAKGDGEISIIQKAFPRTILQIKEMEKHIEQITTGSFYVSENKLFIE
ncbi:hypothetical protein SAMN03159341_12041 [Paenibacillus sp. 1_12]|uniref:DUF342 domain-containing protein n=1 Tax=Paenibacillus sp. 1_12 TaxID=1566278 RepID=UPI0008E5B893|nr:FapA family protein [Paenibacillus sp. 1_12]SFM20247.1 hypothetical protein SAMN03159341_12041 [Paenibacillus sp. 1_12]